MKGHFAKIIWVFMMVIIGSNECIGQQKIKLKKDVIIDTLAFSVNYPSDFDEEKRIRYDSLLEVVIAKKNISSSFFTEINTSKSNYVKVDMDPIKYVDNRDSFKSSGSNLLFFGGHVAMVSTLGWTLPVLILFYPETKSGIRINIDERLVKSSDEIESEIGSNGYFSSLNTQDRRFEKKFQKTFKKLLGNINKQNVRNTKLRSRLDNQGDSAKN